MIKIKEVDKTGMHVKPFRVKHHSKGYYNIFVGKNKVGKFVAFINSGTDTPLFRTVKSYETETEAMLAGYAAHLYAELVHG